MYELIQNVIRILPMLILTVLFIYMLHVKWYIRFISVVLVGWGILVIFVCLYWWYAFNFAPTPEIQNEIALKDSGPSVAVYVLGWAYSLVFYLFLELAALFIKTARRIFKPA